MTRDDLRAALKNRNVVAFLHVIREGETDQTDNAYYKMVGDSPGVYSLSDLSDHPRRTVWIQRLNVSSSAAGAYQFLTRTWDGLVKQYGFPDFSPQCQDEAAVALIAGRKALNAIIEGNLADALDRCSWEWASLPPNRYGQGAMTAERVYDVYDKWGGDFQPAVEEPLTAPLQLAQEDNMPFPALALAALPALIESIPALTRLFGKGEQSEQNAQTAEKVIEIVKSATGTTSIEAALTKVTTEPTARQAANDAVQSAFYTLSEAGGGGLEGARDYNLKAAQAGVVIWNQPAFIISLLLLLFPLLLVIDVFFVHPTLYTGELRTQIITGVLVVIGMIGGFWLGSSFTTSTTRGVGARPPVV